MAKQTFPGIKAGSGLVPKLVGTLVVVAILAVVVKHPGDAATWVKQVGSWAGEAIDGIAAFFRMVIG